MFKCTLTKLQQDRIEKLNSIGFNWSGVIREQLYSKAWFSHIKKIKALAEKGVDCNEIKSTTSLGKWCRAQRKYYKKGELANDRIKALEEVGFVWESLTTQKELKITKIRLKELKEYIAKNGHSNIPRSCKENPSLSYWVSRQRQKYRKQELSKELISTMTKMGFIWDLEKTRWLEKYKLLKKYHRQHGDCAVPNKSRTLASWVKRQRILYKKGILQEDRIYKLEAIGFEWIHKSS